MWVGGDQTTCKVRADVPRQSAEPGCNAPAPVVCVNAQLRDPGNEVALVGEGRGERMADQCAVDCGHAQRAFRVEQALSLQLCRWQAHP
eukprot:CAMPEP_0202904602 /NCGR_PEP_ID=MMETSP1392-20130828/30250_1 /ASSEMBLY_ACC=CAM_ASM_000868 /TAXON_ID=225041 /ORGANISM="Chlamydomonas chlamydogama, Strain SAG 11-48b" /LENGTH=88 /DNA_ID=CAMNT_0049592311 /DNA_START=333 /DNA_END=599 /DNA_ORIENTATION=+